MISRTTQTLCMLPHVCHSTTWYWCNIWIWLHFTFTKMNIHESCCAKKMYFKISLFTFMLKMPFEMQLMRIISSCIAGQTFKTNSIPPYFSLILLVPAEKSTGWGSHPCLNTVHNPRSNLCANERRSKIKKGFIKLSKKFSKSFLWWGSQPCLNADPRSNLCAYSVYRPFRAALPTTFEQSAIHTREALSLVYCYLPRIRMF